MSQYVHPTSCVLLFDRACKTNNYYMGWIMLDGCAFGNVLDKVMDIMSHE